MSYGGADWLTGLEGVTDIEVQGGANGSTVQGWASEDSDRGESLVSRAGAEGLRRGSAGRARGLDNICRDEQTGFTGEHKTGKKSMNGTLGLRGTGRELSVQKQAWCRKQKRAGCTNSLSLQTVIRQPRLRGWDSMTSLQTSPGNPMARAMLPAHIPGQTICWAQALRCSIAQSIIRICSVHRFCWADGWHSAFLLTLADCEWRTIVEGY